MITRRKLLYSAIAVPLCARTSSGRGVAHVQIFPEDTLLSQESAKGYRMLATAADVPLIIVPAVRAISHNFARQLQQATRTGAWVLIESGLCFGSTNEAVALGRTLDKFFGLRIRAPLNAIASSKYVSFHWPHPALIRRFDAVTPVLCRASECIATAQGASIGVRRTVSNGGIVFLGTMLGTGLVAEEREAHAIARAMFHVASPAQLL